MKLRTGVMGRRMLGAMVVAGVLCAGAHAQVRDEHTPRAEEIPAKAWLRSEPGGARTIAETRAKAQVGDAVVIKGRVPDREDAMSATQASFTIEDVGDGASSGAATAVITLNDASGRPRGVSLMGHEGLGRGAEVVVLGKLAAREGDGPIAVTATGIHVSKPVLPAGLFLAAAPEKAQFVADVKKEAKTGEVVQVRGKIGGSVHPFVGGRAVFTIVGNGIPDCSEKDDDHCKTPWDYCCETRKDIAAQSATIQVVDAAGKPIRLDLKGVQGLKELSDVTVVGKAVVADGKSLVVQATGLYINRP
jgi:hypothetical protein